MSAIKIIQALGRKIAAKKAKTPEGITQIQPQIYAETQASNIIERLVNSGLSMDKFDDFIRSEADLVRILNQIEALNKRNFEQSIRSGIKNTETGKVFDLEGKEIDPRSEIMGGKQSETEAEIAARLSKENKEGIARIKNKKMIEEAIDNVSPGFVKGDNKYNAEIVAEEIANKRGLDYYDMDAKQRADIYGEAFDALMKMRDDLAQGGRAGFFMGGPNPKGLGLLRQILNYMSKKGKEQGRFQGADLSALDMLRLSNPKALNRLLEDVRGKVNIREGIMGTDTVSAQQQALREKRKGLTEKSLDVAKAMKAKDIKIKRRIAEEAEYTIIPQIKKQLMEGMGMSEEAAEKAARGMAEAAQNMRLADDPPIITKEGLLQLENVLKNLETGGKKARDLNADGGRIGFKNGMDRRSFLKIMGGLAALPIVGKFFKAGKVATKAAPIVKTPPVPGKPEWFDSLVNKVIAEGEDVTKQLATKEREIVHTVKLTDEPKSGYVSVQNDQVTVYRDLDDGTVRVEYSSVDNMSEAPVNLTFKPGMADETTKVKPADTFQADEIVPESRMDGPDDFVIEDAVDEFDNVVDLNSDVSKLKEFAGKKLTTKEIVEGINKRKRSKAITEDRGEAADFMTSRQGDYDPSDYDDYASGGIARMLGE